MHRKKYSISKGPEKWPDVKFFCWFIDPDPDTGEWHTDGVALFIYSEVLSLTNERSKIGLAGLEKKNREEERASKRRKERKK